MVRLQQSSKPLVTDNRSVARGVARLLCRKGSNIPDSLMQAFSVVVVNVFGDGASQRRFAEVDHPVETLALNRQNESFGKRVQVWTSRRQLAGSNPDSLKNHVESGRELRVPVADLITTFRRHIAASDCE